MLLRTSAVYLLANAISAVIGFAMVMIVTRLLAPADYGVYVIANSFSYILIPLMFTWLRQSLLRFEAEGGATDLRLTALVGYTLTLVLLPVVVVIMWRVAGMSLALSLAAVAFSAALALYELSQEIARARQRPWRFLAAVVIRSSVALTCAVTAALLGYGGMGLIVAAATGHLAAVLALASRTYERPLKPFNRDALKKFASFGAPITFAGVFYAIHSGLDRLLVAGTLGTEAAGQYGAAADLVRQAINLPASAVSAAIAPMAVYIFKNEGAEAVRRHLSDGIVLLASVVGACAVGLAAVAPEAVLIAFGEPYRAVAQVLLPPLALGWIGQAIAHHYVHLSFNLANRAELYIWMGAATLAFGVALIPLCMWMWGLVGAAIGLLVSEVLGIAAGLYLTRKAHPLPFPVAAIARVAVALVAMVLVIVLVRRALPPPSPLTALVLVASGGATYVAALLAFNVLNVRSLMLQLLQRRSAPRAV